MSAPIGIDEIVRLYIEEQWSLRRIASEIGRDRKFVKARLRKAGVKIRGQGHPLVEQSKARKGDKNGKWKGGHYKMSNGYVVVLSPDHKRASKSGYVMRSILVWEKANSKQLPDGWIIHHKNGRKDDDRPENLEAKPESEHKSFHARKSWETHGRIGAKAA